MATHTLNASRRLGFCQMVYDFIDQTDKYLALCGSPSRTEFKFCALLAGWESTACQDSKACHWFEIWQRHCRKRHRGKTGRTLADPVEGAPLSERWHVSQEEQTKAFTKVKDGLRQILKATLNHYCPGQPTDLFVAPRSEDPAVLLQLIHASIRNAKAFANAEGLEVFLLTLIELFEQALGAQEDKLRSRKFWLSEIHRRRLGGSPETRTLADVAPAKIRLERQNAFPEKERVDILKKMLPSMRRIAKELQICLDKRNPCSTDVDCESAHE
jgi:hypothetical protein